MVFLRKSVLTCVFLNVELSHLCLPPPLEAFCTQYFLLSDSSPLGYGEEGNRCYLRKESVQAIFSALSCHTCFLFSTREQQRERERFLGRQNLQAQWRGFQHSPGLILSPRNGLIAFSTQKVPCQFLRQLFHVAGTLYLYKTAISGQYNIFHF